MVLKLRNSTFMALMLVMFTALGLIAISDGPSARDLYPHSAVLNAADSNDEIPSIDMADDLEVGIAPSPAPITRHWLLVIGFSNPTNLYAFVDPFYIRPFSQGPPALTLA